MLTLRGASGPRRGVDLRELHIITDGSLLIEGEILREVGPTRRIENLAAARGAMEINAAGKVVMPGFVDSHTHLAFPPPGADDDHDRALRIIHGTTGRKLRAQSRSYLTAMARHGTTTLEVKTGCGPEESAETKVLRVLASLDGDPLDLQPTFLLRLPEQDRAGAVDWVIGDLLPKIRRRRLARFADLVCDEAPEPAYYAAYLVAARELGFLRKIHAAEDRSSEAVSLAARYDAISVAHLDRVSESDAQVLARSRTIAILTPGTDLEYGSSAGRLLADAGAAVALATNFNPNQPGTLSMQAAVALAHRRMRLSVEEAVSAATINGAHALACADRAGSLEPGKAADLLMLDTSDYRELGRHFGANIVFMAMKGGKPIYREPEIPPAGSRGHRARLC